MLKKILALTLIFSLITSVAHGSDLATVDELRGLFSNPESDKGKDGSHTRFDNAFIEDRNIRVVKGRDRLNSSAHADTVVNMFCYYESSSGTKKLVVKESDEVVTYDNDGTNRTQIKGSLTNEKADCVQEGDTLYFTSTTDGLYSWPGSGSASAVTGVSAPSSVDFTATTGDGGLTPGNSAVVYPKSFTSDTTYQNTSGTCSLGVSYLAAQFGVGGDTSCGGVTCSSTTGGASGICFNSNNYVKTCATSTTYRYKVKEFSNVWGIEGEPSSEDTVTLTGDDTVTLTLKGGHIAYTSNTCATSSFAAMQDFDVVYSGRQTRTTSTIASAPSGPFDGYCLYRTVAGGTDFFKLGCVVGGGSTYTDGKPDTALGDPMDTTIDTISPPTFRYLEAYKGVLFTAEGNAINFTRLPVGAATGADKYWLASDKLLLSADKIITGLIRTKNSLLVTTGTNISEISGFGVGKFKLKTAIEGVGVVSDETCELDTQGDVICFAGTQGVYKIRTFAQPQDDLTGSTIDQDRISIVKVSSPDMDDIFQGYAHDGIDLDPADYATAHAYYDRDLDLYHLYIGQDGFIFDNVNQTWTHLPGTRMVGSLYRKSNNSLGQGVLVDNLGFFFNNWLGYENGIESGTVTGNPTSSTSSTLTDTGATFNTTNDGLKGLWVIVDTAGTLQYRQISSNTATALTVSSNWTSNPTTSSTYYVAYIVFDIKTKQYSFQKPPKLTQLQALTIVNNLAPSTQNLRLEMYADKSSTAAIGFTDAPNPVDLSLDTVNKLGFTALVNWVEFSLRTFVYNTSNTVNPPVDIINYTFRVVPKEDE